MMLKLDEIQILDLVDNPIKIAHDADNEYTILSLRDDVMSLRRYENDQKYVFVTNLDAQRYTFQRTDSYGLRWRGLFHESIRRRTQLVRKDIDTEIGNDDTDLDH